MNNNYSTRLLKAQHAMVSRQRRRVCNEQSLSLEVTLFCFSFCLAPLLSSQELLFGSDLQFSSKLGMETTDSWLWDKKPPSKTTVFP